MPSAKRTLKTRNQNLMKIVLSITYILLFRIFLLATNVCNSLKGKQEKIRFGKQEKIRFANLYKITLLKVDQKKLLFYFSMFRIFLILVIYLTTKGYFSKISEQFSPVLYDPKRSPYYIKDI